MLKSLSAYEEQEIWDSIAESKARQVQERKKEIQELLDRIYELEDRVYELEKHEKEANHVLDDGREGAENGNV